MYPVLVWMLLVMVGGFAVYCSERQSRGELADRFRMRTSIGAQFAATHVADVLRREHDQAWPPRTGRRRRTPTPGFDPCHEPVP